MNNQEAAEMIRDDMKLHHDSLSGEYRKALSMAISALQAQDSPKPTAESIQNVQNEDLILRKAAIDTVKNMRKVCDTDNIDDFYDLLIEAFAVLPSAQPEQMWIPCSERLPEQYGNYLVSYRTDDFESDIGTFDPDRINSDTGEWSACDANGFYWVASKGLEVIAWMPLPEPYREDIE